MAFILDTDVAIHLRDGSTDIEDRIEALGAKLFLSVVTRVELENGVYRDPAWSNVLRNALDTMLRAMVTIPFDGDTLAAYRRIVETLGYSRGKVSDRMIAATALVHDLALVTMNAADFRDIPGLKLEVWPSPSP